VSLSFLTLSLSTRLLNARCGSEQHPITDEELDLLMDREQAMRKYDEMEARAKERKGKAVADQLPTTTTSSQSTTSLGVDKDATATTTTIATTTRKCDIADNAEDGVAGIELSLERPSGEAASRDGFQILEEVVAEF
jgi:hypothetical protein